jgi:hypothetical protein
MWMVFAKWQIIIQDCYLQVWTTIKLPNFAIAIVVVLNMYPSHLHFKL